MDIVAILNNYIYVSMKITFVSSTLTTINVCRGDVILILFALRYITNILCFGCNVCKLASRNLIGTLGSGPVYQTGTTKPTEGCSVSRRLLPSRATRRWTL